MSDFWASVGASGTWVLIGCLFTALYAKIIRPWFDDLLYRGPKIEGVWETTLTFYDDAYSRYQIRLTRYGYKVSGQVRCVEGYSAGCEFNFKGEIITNLLVGTYHATDPKKSALGSLTVMTIGHGNSLQGFISYCDDMSNQVYMTECHAVRTGLDFAWK